MKNEKLKSTAAYWLAFFILHFAFFISSAPANEFDTLRLRWRDLLTQGTNASLSDPLYQNTINSIGNTAQSYWNTLNTNPNRTNLWNALPNLATDSGDISATYARLRTMALAYAVQDSALEGNTALRAAIISGLDWMHANYYNPTGVVYDNWFDFEINSPLYLNDTTALLYADLTAEQISNYMSAVDHFAPTPSYTVISSPVTAANKVWKALVVGLRGLIVQDTNKVELARQALTEVLPYVTTNDGFYADGSFIFHAEFPYNAGYGVEMLDTTAQFLQLFQGSTWQITDPALTNVWRWVHDSFEPFIVRGAAMEMVDGRYHTRNGDAHERGHEILGAILRLAQTAPPAEAAAFKSFVKGAIQADSSRNFISVQSPPYNVWASAALNDTNLVASGETAQHRQFPGMDRVVHRSPNWTFGLAMSSSRVANYESTRGENLRGWFTGEGMTYLYNSDLAHYSDNYWSTVDPYRMPGTTVDVITRTNGSGDSYRSPNNQVGGASILGLYGVAAMHLNAWNSTLSARKSWFMFDNEIVCVGNSVGSSDGRAAETVIENRRLGVYGNNTFTVNGATKPASPGWAETMAGTSWAHLSGTTLGSDIGYYFPPATTVKALRESRSGAFKDINTTYGSSTRNTRHYLTMYLDHGTNPTSGTYSYVLLPGLSASAVAAYAASPDITVVQNNSTTTAVKENRLGLTAVNFWRDTSNQVAGISSDHKAAVILRNNGYVLDLGVSDPTQTNAVGINLEVATAATAALSLDPSISVVQLAPTIKLWVSTSNKFGATLRAQFAVAPIQTNILLPAADAYVQNGDQTNNNFGSQVTLAAKLAGSSQTRDIYLRFDLSSIPGTIQSATLRMLPITINDPLYHSVARVPDNSWGESTITWNNRPPSDPESARWLLGAVASPVFAPLTALAQQAALLDGQLSLRIYSTGTNATGGPTNGGFTAYAAKENGTSANRPQLTITSVRTPPTVVLSSPEDGTATDAPASVTLTAEAQDSDGTIASVDFYCGAMRVAQIFSPPYTTALQDLAASNYTFTAVATDSSGLAATSAPVTVSIHNPEPPGSGSGLNADYFSDRYLATPALSRTDTNVNFFWGFTSPGVGVPADNFSARWTGKVQARHAGLHQFHTVTDEGVRVWVDGKLLIDNWTAHLQTEDSGSLSLVPGRLYDLVMEYYDASASASARLYWTQPGLAKEIIPTSQLYPADQGLRGTYYASTNLTGAVLTRIDDQVNFNWNTNSPDPTSLPGSYSVRWSGKVKANAAGAYTFCTLSDDAVRLWVNGTLLISNWSAHALTEDSNTISLAAGQFYDVTMEYFNLAGVGTAVLAWQPPGESKQVIPSANLTPHRNNTPPTLAGIPNLIAARGGLVTFTATASDPDAAQLLVFSLEGAPPGAAVHPFTGVFSWTPSSTNAFGAHPITLRVIDTGSPTMSDAQTFTVTVLTNMAAASVTLVPTGGVWRYLDSGTDQGTAWRGTSFNDAAWASGAAPFGFGIGGEQTLTSFGPNPSNKYITTYFRRAVLIPDPSLVSSLTARMLRDDVAVVYLNGVEVWRDNLPAGGIGHSTLASSAIGGAAQTQFISTAISPAALVSGTNILAVEMHQDAATSPDLRFDLELVAQAFVPSEGLLSFSQSGGGGVFTWPQAAGLLQLYAATNLAPPVSWRPVTNPPALLNGQWTVPISAPMPGAQFFRLQTP